MEADPEHRVIAEAEAAAQGLDELVDVCDSCWAAARRDFGLD